MWVVRQSSIECAGSQCGTVPLRLPYLSHPTPRAPPPTAAHTRERRDQRRLVHGRSPTVQSVLGLCENFFLLFFYHREKPTEARRNISSRLIVFLCFVFNLLAFVNNVKTKRYWMRPVHNKQWSEKQWQDVPLVCHQSPARGRRQQSQRRKSRETI